MELKYWLKLILSSCLIIVQISPSFQSDGRVVGGEPTTISEAPYLVQLRSKNSVFCSGTLVSEEYVISAAHCFDEKRPQFRVVGGATNIYNDDGSAQSKVYGYIVSDKYDNTTYDMDVAVIRLKKPLVGENIKPISMDCEPIKKNDVVKIFGWGKLNASDKTVPIQLQTTEVKAIEYSWCKWSYFNKRKITNNMFCASAKGKDACSGDSGGPAVVKGKLCGVISWGVGCATRKHPGVYSNLRATSTFVKDAMEKLATLYPEK